MYICVCRTINDTKIRDFVENHQDICRRQSIAKIYNAISGERPNCGKCLPAFKETVNKKLAELDKDTSVKYYTPKKK